MGGVGAILPTRVHPCTLPNHIDYRYTERQGIASTHSFELWFQSELHLLYFLRVFKILNERLCPRILAPVS